MLCNYRNIYHDMCTFLPYYNKKSSSQVDIKVKIAVGVPMKNVLVEEIIAMQATWAILDRYH